ncbi:hypothetical protein V5N34_27505 [Streptomyces baarnensis]|uniref:hypothetical protein n=1 Tax=Streptomyces TaxID=1883 RepID=UPI0029A47CE7|nr:hypothetical protein [Streptomyces sp. ME02-6979.5a]MDX3342561.1 hypothetical protein [Streptomyces sp. ME02-6979.5a]
MGHHRGISAYLQALKLGRRRPFAVDTSATLTALAHQVFSDPSMAGESSRFLALWDPRRPEPLTVKAELLLGFDLGKIDRTYELRPILHHIGSGKSGVWTHFAAAMRAERRWADLQRRAIQARSDVVAVLALTRSLAKVIPQAVPTAMAARPKARRAFFSPVLTSGIPALNAMVQGTRETIESLRVLTAVEADWSSLQADLTYWRRAADELWRLVTGLVVPPPKPAEVVFLDTAPCGISRLTGVRVPRAPGSGRTTPIPSSSLLAAA